MDCEIFESDSSLVVRMDASQAFDPGSSPGYRISFLFLINNNNKASILKPVLFPIFFNNINLCLTEMKSNSLS